MSPATFRPLHITAGILLGGFVLGYSLARHEASDMPLASLGVLPGRS